MQNMSLSALQEKFCKKLVSRKLNTMIIDIRAPEEYHHKHIPNAINIPINRLSLLKASQYADKVAIFHCRSGKRTLMNEQAINATPFKEKYCLQGEINEWKSANLW